MVTPRVTVLMPVFNAERYLRKAINSMLSQTFTAFEFLIIDDGSSDGSADVIAGFDDPRIRFVRNARNLGITATLNKGIQLASCELIARMDADDLSRPDRLRIQYSYMMQHPDCALTSGWAHVVTEDERHVCMERFRHPFLYYNLTFECWIYHPTVMFRKSCVEALGGYTQPYSEDYDLFWRLSTRYRIVQLEVPLLDYRLSPTSLNTVLRRREYEEAHVANVVGHIHYYLGDTDVRPAALACLRHEFTPVAQSRDLDAVVEAVTIADRVARAMTGRANPNRDARAIRRALRCKRRFMISGVARALPLALALQLLWRTRAGTTFLCLVRDVFKWHLKMLIRGKSPMNHARPSGYQHAV